MAHRGRLNVLANIASKEPGRHLPRIRRSREPDDAGNFSGDVKYHLGAPASTKPRRPGIGMEVAANPSHLEAVDPVAGGDRPGQQENWDRAARMVLPVLLHGDAAFAGQGVVAETLNLSQLPRLPDRWHRPHRDQQPGRIHHAAVDARSSFYATDVAKTVAAPIIHVNGDDPEAVSGLPGWPSPSAQAFNQRCRNRHGLLSAPGAQRGRRAQLHPAASCTADRQKRPRFASCTWSGWSTPGSTRRTRSKRCRRSYRCSTKPLRRRSQSSSGRTAAGPCGPMRPPRRCDPGGRRGAGRSHRGVDHSLPEGFTVHPKLASSWRSGQSAPGRAGRLGDGGGTGFRHHGARGGAG